MNTNIKAHAYALFLILCLSLTLGAAQGWAADSTDLNPQRVRQKTYICSTTDTHPHTYRSAEWDCNHMELAHSCKKDDVVIGLFSRFTWVMTKFNWGYVCSYRCARVRPDCHWEYS